MVIFDKMYLMVLDVIIKMTFLVFFREIYINCEYVYQKTIEDLSYEYEDDKNSMIALQPKDDDVLYEDFYDERDNWMAVENSLNIIFFGPPISFMRMDSESILHILALTKKHLIPISRVLLAWDLITDGKTAAFLQGREFLAFGSLLNIIPEEDLYYVNFADPSVLNYFANHHVELQDRKYGILVAAYKRYFGTEWFTNGTYINEMGYLICGFPESNLRRISPQVLTEISVETIFKLRRCTTKQTKVLYDLAIQREAFGTPYQWSSHEVARIGILLTFIPDELISSLQLEAMAGITPEVMKALELNKLSCFTMQQILRMNENTRRIYILRMQLKNSLDMTQLVKKSGAGLVLPRHFSVLILLQLWLPYSRI